MNEPMTAEQFEQTFGFSIKHASDQELAAFLRSGNFHSAEVRELLKCITYDPLIIRDTYMTDDFRVLEAVLRLADPPDLLRKHSVNIKNYLFAMQASAIYERENIHTFETTKFYLETGQKREKQLVVGYRRFFHNETKRCKGNVTRSLRELRNTPALLELIVACISRDEQWAKRRGIAIFRASIVNWYKQPKDQRQPKDQPPHKITTFELVMLNRNYRRHIASNF